jgi:uncharacterized protein YjbJ (UPF0337 family)
MIKKELKEEWSTAMSEKTDQIKGRIKEAAGVLTDNDRLKRKGKLDQAVGKVKETVSLSGVAAQVKGLITRGHMHEDKQSYWQLVFSQSKANGCLYHGEDRPQINWEWPKNTWFQEQLRSIYYRSRA